MRRWAGRKKVFCGRGDTIVSMRREPAGRWKCGRASAKKYRSETE